MTNLPATPPLARRTAWERVRASKGFWVVVGAVISFALVSAGRAIGVQKDWRELQNSGRVEFNRAADIERDFYAGLYRDHLSIAGREDAVRGRSHEVIGITLTSRRVPENALQEFSYGLGVKACDEACRGSLSCRASHIFRRKERRACAAEARCARRIACEVRTARLTELMSYRQGLERLIALEGASAPVQEIAFSSDQSSAVRTRDPQGALLSTPQPVAPVERPPLATSVEALPLASVVLADANPKGWDVDVFWCGRDGGGEEAELARYRRASAAAQRLADVARRGETASSRAETITLGRIRLRPLPAATNARLPGYQFTRDELRYEAATEAVVGGAVRNWTKLQLFAQEVQNAPPTPWYLSVFICGGAASGGTRAPGPATARS